MVPAPAVSVWLPFNAKVLLAALMLIVMADDALVALFIAMLPLPLKVRPPVELIEMVPVALLVAMEPELVNVPPPAIVIATLDDVAPLGAAAEMVPLLRKVP